MAAARHFTELVAWQLADQLRILVFTLSSLPGLDRDFRLRSQMEDAVNSVCRNIAEGFGCETHAEFARFLGISRRSINELLDTLRAAQLKGFVAPDDIAPIHQLTRRLYPALSNLIAHLRRNPTHKR